MRRVSYATQLSRYAWFYEREVLTDYYLAFRSYLLVGLGTILLFALIVRVFQKKVWFSWSSHRAFYCGLLLYVIGIIGSTVCSTDLLISLRGGFEQFESAFVLISYLILLLYVKNADINLNSFLISLARFCLVVSSVVLIILGFLQKDEVYLTFYNPNYAAVYLNLILPIMIWLTLSAFSKSVKKLYPYVLALISIGLIICLIRTESTLQILIFIIEMILLFLFEGRLKPAVSVRLFLVGGGILLIGSVIIVLCVIRQPYIQPHIADISTNDSDVTLVLDGKPLSFSSDATTSAQELAYHVDTRQLADGPSFNGFTISTGYENQFFTNETEDGTYYFLTPFDKFMKLAPAKSLLFTNCPSFLSGRGYIWARTLPLLSDCLLTGYGPDTFILHFPHNDYGAAVETNNLYHVITKPHSLYLQIATQTGILSLIGFLMVCGVYFVTTIKKYRHTQSAAVFDKFYMAIFVSVIGYLLSGLLNDSCVAVAPYCWVLLGLGFRSSSS